MKLTKSTKVITRKALTDKILASLANDDNECNSDDAEENGAFDDLQSDVENLLALRSSKAQKWVAIFDDEYISLSDFKNHYHTDSVGGTDFDTNVVKIEL